jgi:hypothetical protein
LTTSDVSLREVIVSASDLEEKNEDEAGRDGYINPSLLLTQNSFTSRHSGGFDLKTSSVASILNEVSETPTDDLAVILSQRKSTPQSSNPKPQNKSIADFLAHKSNSVISSTKPLNKAPSSSFALLMNSDTTLSAKLREKSKAPLITSDSSAISRGDSKRMIGLQSSDNFSSSQLHSGIAEQPENLVRKPTASQNSSGIRSFFSQSHAIESSVSDIDENSEKKTNPKVLFKELMGKVSISTRMTFLAQLKTQLTENSHTLMMNEIKRIAAHSRENGSIQDVGQVNFK